MASILPPEGAAKIAAYWLRHCGQLKYDTLMIDVIGSYCDQVLDSLISGLDTPKLVHLIRAAETAERYDDMRHFVKKLVEIKCEKGEDLNVDERNLMNVAFQNMLGGYRGPWRTLHGGFDDSYEELLKKYRMILENEMESEMMEVIQLLTDHLCPFVKGNGDETEVFYLKMCGDYYRHLCSFRIGSEDRAKENKSKAEEFYKKAMDIAEANLNETHPTRLGVALNFSLCYYEILKEPEKAVDLAKKSFAAALEKLDTVSDVSYKESTLIMQLLRDNLTLWTAAE